jgi:hypothetical protein
MNVARIKDGVVVNIEVADEEWVAANNGVDGYEFIESTEEMPAHVGLSWEPIGGFEQPYVAPVDPPTEPTEAA